MMNPEVLEALATKRKAKMSPDAKSPTENSTWDCAFGGQVNFRYYLLTGVLTRQGRELCPRGH